MTAFIFDLDGTLIRSESLFFDAAQSLFKQWGHSLTELTPQERSRVPGRSAAENMAFYLKRFGLKGDPERLAAERLELLLKNLKKQGVPLILGAKDFLKSARSLGIPMALATSSPRNYAETVFEVTGLNTFFDVVITGTEIERYKPDPQIFLKAADHLAIPPTKCVVFEDAHAGFIAARKAGMALVALPAPLTLADQQKMADIFIQDFTELTPADCLALVR